MLAELILCILTPGLCVYVPLLMSLFTLLSADLVPTTDLNNLMSDICILWVNVKTSLRIVLPLHTPLSYSTTPFSHSWSSAAA
jgi:hypothetical protein